MKNLFIEKANKIHNNKYDYSLVNYINNKIKIKIICPEHGVFLQTPNSHLSGIGCPICGGSKKMTTEEFIARANKIHNNKYDYSLVQYKNAVSKVKIICPEHGIFEQRPNNHINIANGCPNCCKNIKINTEEFIIRANKIHNNKYDYSLVNYINSYTKVKIICPEHGIFEQRPNQHLSQKSGCPICNESKSELEIAKILKENDIKHIREYVFDDCKNINPLPFDFYLPEQNLLIEYDGIQHFKSFDYLGGINELNRRKNNDRIKTNYCINNDIRLIRIKYTQNIKERLIQEKIIWK